MTHHDTLIPINPTMREGRTDHINTDFGDFIGNFKNKLKHVFHEMGDINRLSLDRGLPPEIRREIMSAVPLAVAIPTAYGGRGCIVKECLGVLSAASYESLSLSLTFGINIALFLEPVAKYAQEEVKPDIFARFLEEQNMGGLMITEPAFGSDALNMKTSYRELDDAYRIQGMKHWQGLTGLADYWIIASRREVAGGELARDIDFFICDVNQRLQAIHVEESFDSLGLYMIPYGRNRLDIEVPKNFKLIPETTGIKMMLDILHRSRLQFPGMGMGFIQRMLDEAIKHCTSRMVGKSNLLAMDQVQFQLARIQSAYTICSAMCARSSDISGIAHNLAGEGLEANSMKAVVTDMMQESAQLLVQLSGASGYRISHIGGRGIMDSRPFQIFEGSNEMLYSQIAEIILKGMKITKEPVLVDFLKTFPLTYKAQEYVKDELNIRMDGVTQQRKLVDLGRILARIICLGYVIDLREKGFRKDLVDNCIHSIQHEIAVLVRSFTHTSTVGAIYDYKEGSCWSDF